MMYRTNSPTMIRPGNSMAANSSPTETCASEAYTTATTDGGIIVPSEPPAQMVPAISELS
ncbi:hypothetical protein D9M68_990070 [compost metagenome]